MSTTTQVTADELLTMPAGMGKRYELVAGVLRIMSPAGWRHGKVVSRLGTRIAAFVEKHNLGDTFGAETGFRLATNPDTVPRPDASFISNANLPTREPKDGFWPGPPDLAVEVLSPGDRTGEVDEKIEAWLAAGCRSIWIVDPKLQTVAIYRSLTDVEIKTSQETLTGDPVLPGFSCPVAELFR